RRPARHPGRADRTTRPLRPRGAAGRRRTDAGGELNMAATNPPVRAASGARYTAADIEVLEGLEPVRKRPAMYIGGTDARGYHHLLWEIVDNAVDEAINGFAKRIEVTLDADHRGASVFDDGRGIPVDIHPKYKK